MEPFDLELDFIEVAELGEFGAPLRNNAYHLYVLPDELVGLWVGKAAASLDNLVGGIAGAIGKWFTPSPPPETSKRPPPPSLDARALAELRYSHPMHFSIRFDDIKTLQLALPDSYFMRYQLHVPHYAMLRFLTHGGVESTFLIRTLNDVHYAVQTLPFLLGDKIWLDLQWDECKQKYVRA